MRPRTKTLTPEGVFLLLALTLGWGINWPIMKLILTEIPPLSFRGFCLFVGGCGILFIARLNGHSLRIPRQYWQKVFWISMINILAWNVMATYGLSMLPAGRSALLGYTMPLWVVLFSIWILNERFNLHLAIALLLGMLGVALLLSDSVLHLLATHLDHSLLIGSLLMLTAASCWGLGTNLMKRWAIPVNSMVLTGWLLALAGIPSLLAATQVDDLSQLSPSRFALIGLVYNVLVAFMFCYWAWIRLVEITPVAVSSISSLLTPLVGVFSSIWLLNETPSWQDYTAAGLILGAVALINLRRH